jgi:Zn-dependent M28 family amino/carboxypeptidase
MIVFFNREEDGLLGSRDFVSQLAGQSAWSVDEAHIFEMVGFRTFAPRSQAMPPSVPGVVAPEVGDFLALIANQHSNATADELITLAASYIPATHVLGLKIYMGIEKSVGHLHRSDHAPYWRAGIPAIMWTDTAEFRNPHYHRATDTPEKLDYEFVTDVTKLALARAVSREATTS